MPAKWIAAAAALMVLVFGSGCSLAVKQAIEAEQQKEVKQAEKKEEPSNDSSEEEADEDTDAAQPPSNSDDFDSQNPDDSDSYLEGNEVTVSHLKVKTDKRNWQEANSETQTEDNLKVETTSLTVDGDTSINVDEMIMVQYIPGLQKEATAQQYAQAVIKGDESSGRSEWNVLEAQEDSVLSEVKVKDDPEIADMSGVVRFLSTDKGMYILYYLTSDMNMPQDKKSKWQYLLKQAKGDEGVTL
ncbi:hypothetical protein [Paludifilum halophilum]|uniref:PsbP C-terminal domain-containing protein n=1 Tax=Paludifilum halophilum TaxID=1642702 RepID=A0A235B4U2_9BACL|nr:hypothetical protein [Paludifilum halophilum]OYD07328.1 hypothetical protein CHM34_10450 [Paludifilum halophilum]